MDKAFSCGLMALEQFLLQNRLWQSNARHDIRLLLLHLVLVKNPGQKLAATHLSLNNL